MDYLALHRPVSPERATASDRLRLLREHRAIETLMHGVRDKTLKEDVCRV